MDIKENLEKIREKIKELEKEGEELRGLKSGADTYRYFRGQLRKTKEHMYFD